MWSIFSPRHPIYAPREIDPQELPGILRLNIWTGVLGMLCISTLFGGPFFTTYAVSMGMTQRMFGVLSTLRQPMILMMLGAGALERAFGGRKYPFFVTAMASRLVTLPLLLALVMPVTPWMIIAIIVTSTALMQLSAPIWHSWTWSYIPSESFGRFQTRRSAWAVMGRLPLAIAGAFAIDRLPSEHRMPVLCAVFALAMVAGLVDLLFHVRIPEAPRRVPRQSTVTMIREAFRNVPLRNLMFANALWYFGVFIGGPFCLPFMSDTLGYGERFVEFTLLTLAVPGVSALATLWIWGRLCDRTRHPGLIAAVCYGGWAVIPLFYYCASPEAPFWPMLGVWIVAGVFPGGATTVSMLLTARHSGEDKTMPAALMNIMPALGGALGAAVGTLIVARCADDPRPAFFVSFAARSVAALVVLLLLVYVPRCEERELAAASGGVESA